MKRAALEQELKQLLDAKRQIKQKINECNHTLRQMDLFALLDNPSCRILHLIPNMQEYALPMGIVRCNDFTYGAMYHRRHGSHDWCKWDDNDPDGDLAGFRFHGNLIQGFDVNIDQLQINPDMDDFPRDGWDTGKRIVGTFVFSCDVLCRAEVYDDLQKAIFKNIDTDESDAN